VDPDGEFFWLAGIIGFAVGYVSHGISTGDWGGNALKSAFIGGASALIGAGAGWGVSTLTSGLGSGLSGIIGGVAGGSVAGFSSAAMTGGNLAQGAIFGAIGGAIGGASNMLSKGMGFWERGLLSTAVGGLTGGGLSALGGGSFWDGFGKGALGAAAGFAGNEIAKYLKQSSAETKAMEAELGLTKEDIKLLKRYGSGKLPIKDFSNEHNALWEKLQSLRTVDDSQFPHKFRTFDLDRNAIIRVGRLHIRLGTELMINEGAYGFNIENAGSINIHYDKFDVVMRPLTHWLLDSKYQEWRHGVR